jgi:hypothetical protein
VVALALAILLLRSSIYHIQNEYAFLMAVYSYQLFNPTMGLVVASILPYLQLSLAIALLFFGRLRGTSFACCGVLFLIYAIGQLVAHLRGLDIACGCFVPSSEKPISILSITALGALGALAVFCAIIDRRDAKTNEC